MTLDAAPWVESQHKRGQPGNKGQFAPTSGGVGGVVHGGGEERKTPVGQASPITKAHHEAAKHIQKMGHAVSSIKIDHTQSPVTSIHSQPYNIIGEVHPQSGATLYTAKTSMSNSASIAHNLSELKGSFSKNEKAIVKQEVNNIDELYQKARQAEPSFKKAVEEVARLVGGMAEFTPAEYAEPGTTLKSRKSAERKLADFNGDASQLLDIVRGTVACNTVEEVRTAAKAFMEKYGERVVRVKDRIVMPVQGGYRDILVNFRTDTGVIAELQFNSDEMIKAKLGDGHRMYEALRILNTKERNKDIHKRMMEFLEKKSELLYQTAYKLGGNGDWG